MEYHDWTDDVHAVGIRLLADDLQQQLFDSAWRQVVNGRVILVPKAVLQLHRFYDPPNSTQYTHPRGKSKLKAMLHELVFPVVETSDGSTSTGNWRL